MAFSWENWSSVPRMNTNISSLQSIIIFRQLYQCTALWCCHYHNLLGWWLPCCFYYVLPEFVVKGSQQDHETRSFATPTPALRQELCLLVNCISGMFLRRRVLSPHSLVNPPTSVAITRLTSFCACSKTASLRLRADFLPPWVGWYNFPSSGWWTMGYRSLLHRPAMIMQPVLRDTNRPVKAFSLKLEVTQLVSFPPTLTAKPISLFLCHPQARYGLPASRSAHQAGFHGTWGTKWGNCATSSCGSSLCWEQLPLICGCSQTYSRATVFSPSFCQRTACRATSEASPATWEHVSVRNITAPLPVGLRI